MKMDMKNVIQAKFSIMCLMELIVLHISFGTVCLVGSYTHSVNCNWFSGVNAWTEAPAGPDVYVFDRNITLE